MWLGTEGNNTNLDHIDFLPFHSNWAQKLHLWNSTPWIFRRKDGFGHRRRIHEKMSLALRLKESKNQEKACLCPNVAKEAKNDGEQIKKKLSCAQTPQKKRKTTGNKSRKTLPMPKHHKKAKHHKEAITEWRPTTYRKPHPASIRNFCYAVWTRAGNKLIIFFSENN